MPTPSHTLPDESPAALIAIARAAYLTSDADLLRHATLALWERHGIRLAFDERPADVASTEGIDHD